MSQAVGTITTPTVNLVARHDEYRSKIDVKDGVDRERLPVAIIMEQ